MNKLLSLAYCACSLALMGGLLSCDSPYKQEECKFSKSMDLNNDRFKLGLPVGAKAMHVGEQLFTKARLSYYNNNHAAYTDLLQGKIDAYLYDSHALDYVAANSPDMAVLTDSVGKVDIAIGIAPKNKELLAPINSFIESYKKDGTYDDMYKRWVRPAKLEEGLAFEPLETPEMPQISIPQTPTRTLVVGTSCEVEPMCFRAPGNKKNSKDLIGFDMELLRRLALHLNVRCEIREMDYVALVNGLANNELDIVIAGLNKTEARQQRNIVFSNNYIDSKIVTLVRSTQVAEPSDSTK